MTVLDRIAPNETHLPPSARTWARVIQVPSLLGDVLELRDPNSGLSEIDPASKPRHQYVVARGAVWVRRLPPAALNRPEDETPWEDGLPLRWSLAVLGSDSLIREWAEESTGGPIGHVSPTPERVTVGADIHGDGAAKCTAYIMPPQDPSETWPDITSYPDEGHIVSCPVLGCAQHLVWYEAGYVPGYRVCMAPIPGSDGYDHESLRHRFVLDREQPQKRCVLIQEDE